MATELDVYGGYTAANERRANQRAQSLNRARNELTRRELTRDRTAGEILSDTAIGGLQGAVELGRAAYGLGNLASFGMLEAGVGLAENFDRTSQILQQNKSQQLRFQAQQNERTFEDEGVVAGVMDFVSNPALLADLAVTQAPSILPAAGAGTFAARRVLQGGAARGMTKEAVGKVAREKATKAAVLTGGAQMGGTAYVNAYNQAIEEGLSPSEANARALAAGAATGAAGVAISKLPGVGAAGVEGAAAARAVGVPGLTGNFARQVGSATGREASEEFLQSGAEEMIQNVASERKALMDGVAKNAAMGAVGGGLLGAGMGVIPAAADFRADLKNVMDEAAAEAGVGELATSNLEQQGEQTLESEARAQKAAQRTIDAATERLVSQGFVANEDGTFSRPGDVLYGEGPFTLDQALEIAADESPELEAATEQPQGLREQPAPLPTVDEIPADVEPEPLPTAEVEDSAAPADAYQKAQESIASLGLKEKLVDGQRMYELSDGTTTLDMDDVSAIELARQQGLITDDEAQIAQQYAQQPEVVNTLPEVEEITAEQVRTEQQRREEETILQTSGFYQEPDTDTYWGIGKDGFDRQFTREEALQELGYVPAGQDLLGDPDATRLPEPQEPVVAVPDATPAEQYALRGIDPLFEAVDDANRRDAGQAKLLELAKTPELLPAPEGQDIRDSWSRVMDGAVEAHNSTVPVAERINFTQSMRKSAVLRNFVESAVSINIQPGSPESFDFLAEQARAVEAEGAKATQVIAAVADIAGTIAPGTASLPRWRKALARKGIAKPGNMRGPAYQAFKEAAGKATVTPGSVEFDTFMRNFSASLTEEQAATKFGSDIRTAYPYDPPTVAQAKAKTAKQKQVTGKPSTAKLPPIGAGIAPLVKTAREKALTEPTPEPTTEQAKAAEPEASKQKRATRKALNETAVQAKNAVRDTEREVNRVRNAALVEEDDTGAVDPDVARAEREAQPRPEQPKSPMSQEAIDTANSLIYEVVQRISRLSAGFAEQVAALRSVYVTPQAARAAGRAEQVQIQKALTAVIRDRLLTVDKALTKDAGDIATWGGVVGTVMNSDVIQDYADNGTAYTEFLQPAMERFTGFVTEAETADGIRIYREVLKDLGVEEFIDNQLTGKVKARAKKEMAQLNRFMDVTIERMTADPANSNNVHPFKTNKGKYSTAEQAQPQVVLPRNELDDIVNEWNLNRPPTSTPFTVYDTVAEAQDALGIAVPAAANGVYYNGRASVIAENISSAQMAREVILHERTHGGLEALLGQDRLNAVMNRVWANAQLRRRTQAKMKRHQINRIQAAEEVIVDMVVNGEQLNKSLFSKIRAAVTRMAESVFGLTDYVAPDSMVNELLSDTADYLRGAKSELNLSESYATGLEAYQAVFEGKSVPKSPMFSVATAELEKWSSGEVSDVAAFQDKFQKANAEGLRDNWKSKSVDRVTSLGSEISRISMDMLPASQIAALNRGLFWDTETRVDRLKQFVDDKMAKENEFNKVIQSKRKMYYAYGDQGQQDFNESLMDIADDWGKLTTARGKQDQVTAMNQVNQLGTFYKIFPDRTWEGQTEINYDRENYTEADRKRAYAQIRQQWNAMTGDTKQLYRRVQAAYANVWAERMAELRKQSDRIAEASTEMPDPDQPSRSIPAKEWRKKMDQKISMAIGRIKQGPYSPLQRFGNYYVVVRDPEGKVVFNSGHESEADAKGMEQSMRDGLQEGYTIATALRDEHIGSLDAMSTQHYNQIRDAIKGVFPGDTRSDELARTQALAAMEEVMLQTLPDHSLLKHANTRKGIAGATPDAFRAFNDYAIKSARNLSSMRYDHKIQGALSEMRKFASSQDQTALNLKRGKVFNAIQRQHYESQNANVSPYSTFATSTAFMMYMTSPSQLFLNASQTALVSMPVMAAKYGIGDTMKYMKEAFTEFGRSKGLGMHSDSGQLDPNSVMYAVMQSLNNDGTLDFTQSHDLSDMAQRESDLMHSNWRRITHHASTFMRLSEVFNREVAAYIAVRGEMRKAGVTDQQFRGLPQQRQAELMEQWTTTARDAVTETQFIYNQSNKARLMQGNFGRVVFQFQQFRVNMLALIARTVRDSIKGVQDPSLSLAQQRQETALARRTLAYMTVTQLALTGAASSVIAPVAFALMDLFRDDDELLNTEEAFLQAAPQWLSMGLVGGILDPQRFGFNTLVPILGGSRYMPADDDPQRTFDHILLNSMGPMYGIGSQFLRGTDKLMDGDFVKAAADFLPKPMADAYKVIVSEQREVQDRQGITWYERTNMDMAWNFLGLKTGDQAVAQADRSAIYSGTQRASDRRSKLVFEYVRAPDAAARSDAVADIADWNRKWGSDSSLVISGSTLKQATKTRLEKEVNAQLYGVPSTRTPDALRRLVND